MKSRVKGEFKPNENDYTYNDIIIENNRQNVYIDLEGRIKALKANWDNRENFFQILRELDYEILGEDIYLGEGNFEQNEESFTSHNNNKIKQNNNINENISYISNDFQRPLNLE